MSRLLWQTVSNAANKSIAMQTVRSVSSSGRITLRCPLLAAGAGRRYLLMVGRIRVSMAFMAGQRSEMGGYEDPWEMSLPGFGIGMINDDFHIAGI